MKIAAVRTTITLPTALIQAVDQAVHNGMAKSRNELIAQALRHELAAQERALIDQAFASMADDDIFQAEAIQIAEEFAMADWDALQTADK